MTIAGCGDWQHVATGCTAVVPEPFYDPFSGIIRVSRCQKGTSGLYGVTEADKLTIWMSTTPSGLSSAHLHHPPLVWYLD